MRKMLFALLLASSAAACHETGDVEYAGEVHVASPELVSVSPGVQVVADADQPLFYADGSYWLYRDNMWLRSDNYQRGFARVDATIVPAEVRVIDQPQRYVHYRRHQGENFARPGDVRTRAPNTPQGTRLDQSQQYPTGQAPTNTTPIESTTTPTPPGSTRPNVPSSEPNPRLTPEQREPIPQQHTAPDIDRTGGDTSRHDVDRPTNQSRTPTDHDNDKVDHTDRNVPNPHATDHGKAVGHDKDKDRDKDKDKDDTNRGRGMNAGANPGGNNGTATANGTAGTATTSDTGNNATDTVPNGSRVGDQNDDRTQFSGDNRASHAPNEGTNRADDAKGKAKATDTKNQNKSKDKDY